jgi:hypothetical protein
MTPKEISSVILVLCSALAPVARASLAAIQSEETKLLPSDGSAGDRFGVAVAISGDTALIGSSFDDDSGVNSGSAYIFERDRGVWTERAKLLPSDGAAHDQFGAAVSVSGDTAVVGTWPYLEESSRPGSAYVFVGSGGAWTQQAKLLPDDHPTLSLFGFTTSVFGNTAVVGAPDDSENGPASGSAYVFVRDGEVWTQQAKLLPNDGAAGDMFGFSASLNGITAVVGAIEDDDRGPGTGSAYVFVRQGEVWTQQAKLLPNDDPPPWYFGWAVAVSGDTAVIGVRDEKDPNRGAAYVFARSGDTWTQQAKLLASDGAVSDFFGRAVSISGNNAVIGAYFNDDNGFNSGSAYLFHRHGGVWTERAKLLPSDGATQDFFGWSVAVTGGTALIAAWRDDDNGGNSGSAYLFPISLIFADGLESGDCSGWSFEVPQPRLP